MIRRIRPVWPCPRNVRAFTTTRQGGVSTGPWQSLNLGDACGDDAQAVAENRARFAMALPGPPGWLRQVHGSTVLRREAFSNETPQADAVVSGTRGLPCTILTADCLPVLLCSRDGRQVAAAHAGWRGLVAGVLEATVAVMDAEPENILAWLGPGISQPAYQVDEPFRGAVLAAYPQAEHCFTRIDAHLHADLYALARVALAGAGVTALYGGGYCTHAQPERFYSYRRDGVTGRMASTIWIHDAPPEPENDPGAEPTVDSVPNDDGGQVAGDGGGGRNRGPVSG